MTYSNLLGVLGVLAVSVSSIRAKIGGCEYTKAYYSDLGFAWDRNDLHLLPAYFSMMKG